MKIKMTALVLCVVFLIIGCGNVNDNKNNTTVDNLGSRFKVIKYTNYGGEYISRFETVYDVETGVEYTVNQDGQLTILVDENGNPLIYEEAGYDYINNESDKKFEDNDNKNDEDADDEKDIDYTAYYQDQVSRYYENSTSICTISVEGYSSYGLFGSGDEGGLFGSASSAKDTYFSVVDNRSVNRENRIDIFENGELKYYVSNGIFHNINYPNLSFSEGYLALTSLDYTIRVGDPKYDDGELAGMDTTTVLQL